MSFQSTRPRGTRLPVSDCQTSIMCFNPRVREGRDMPLCLIPLGVQVSIHASARDATWRLPCEQGGSTFQSTRPRGTRPGRSLTGDALPRFNPRVREGRDTRGRPPPGTAEVSIHASARDATQRLANHEVRPLFQSTRPRGTRRSVSIALRRHKLMFQSTRPRGTRPGSGMAGWLGRVFQSTRPRGTRHIYRI